jgi:hypothetical protein
VLFDIARTLDVLVDFDVLAGDLAAAEAHETEASDLFIRLGIRTDSDRHTRPAAATDGVPAPA